MFFFGQPKLERTIKKPYPTSIGHEPTTMAASAIPADLSPAFSFEEPGHSGFLSGGDCRSVTHRWQPLPTVSFHTPSLLKGPCDIPVRSPSEWEGQIRAGRCSGPRRNLGCFDCVAGGLRCGGVVSPFAVDFVPVCSGPNCRTDPEFSSVT